MTPTAGFPDLVRKILIERGTVIARNPRVFNSLLADYAQGKYRKERRAFIAELVSGRCQTVDEALAVILPPVPILAPPVFAPPVPVPRPMPAPEPEKTPVENKKEKIHHWLDKGFLHLKLKEPEQADQFFRKALDRDDECAYAWFGHGCAESQLYHLDQAVHYFEIALDCFQAEGNRKMIKECKDAISELQRRMRDDKEKNDEIIDGVFKLAAGFLDVLFN